MPQSHTQKQSSQHGGVDANETFTPPSNGATGCHATTGRGAIILDWLEHASYTLPPQQLRTPSYYPYNPLMQPRRLDYVATRGITPGEGKVHPCRDRAASDHDAVAIPVGKHKGGGPTRATWGPRRLRPPHQVQQLLAVPPPKGEDTRQVLSALAHAITVSGEHQQIPRERHPQADAQSSSNSPGRPSSQNGMEGGGKTAETRATSMVTTAGDPSSTTRLESYAIPPNPEHTQGLAPSPQRRPPMATAPGGPHADHLRQTPTKRRGSPNGSPQATAPAQV